MSRIVQSYGRGLRDPRFERLLRRIHRGAVFAGNRVEIFIAGDAAFRSMREALREAREEVLLESYILRDDATGWEFLDELGAAVDRGVTVRLLADAFGSAMTRHSFWIEMRRRGIEARLFHPFFPHFWNEPFRDHRKILTIDRKVAFIGGMNIGEEYGSARNPSPRAWRDTHARLEGPAVWDLVTVFSEGWLRAGGTPFEIEPLKPPRGAGARVLVLDWRPRRGHEQAEAVFEAILAGSRRRLWITSSYFAPRPHTVELLCDAAGRGVDVRLLLPAVTDVPIMRHAAHSQYARLLAAGVKIFEYEGATLHAKSFVADGFLSLVGSTNLDFRSLHFNGECNLVVFDFDTADQLEAVFEEDLRHSREIDLQSWRRRPLAHRLGDFLAGTLRPLL